MKQGYKECPYCANSIKEWALKCQYCWEFFNKTTDNITNEYNKTSMPLYVKIIIWTVIFIFLVIIISYFSGNKSSSSNLISYNDTIVDNVSACYNSFDNIPDNPWDLSYNELHQIVIDGLSICKVSKSNVISLWWWKWDFRLQEASENFTNLAISFLNEYEDYILYLYPDKWKDFSNLEKDTESLRNSWQKVDDARWVIVDTQKDFAKKYNYKLE